MHIIHHLFLYLSTGFRSCSAPQVRRSLRAPDRLVVFRATRPHRERPPDRERAALWRARQKLKHPFFEVPRMEGAVPGGGGCGGVAADLLAVGTHCVRWNRAQGFGDLLPKLAVAELMRDGALECRLRRELCQKRAELAFGQHGDREGAHVSRTR